MPKLTDWTENALLFDDGSAVTLPPSFWVESMVSGDELWIFGCRGGRWTSASFHAGANRGEVEAAVRRAIDGLNCPDR